MLRRWRGWTVALIAFVLLAELALRVVPRAAFPQLRLLDRVYDARSAWTKMMTGDPHLGYKLRPGVSMAFPSEGGPVSFETVSLGLDDVGFRDIGTKPPFSMVAVGGSFTVCDDVSAEACWVRRVSDALAAPTATLAVNGYSTLAAARMFERFGRRLRPRVVLLEVHPNDFRDNVSFDRWQRSGDPNMWEWLGRHRGRTPVMRWLGGHSMLFRLFDGGRKGIHRDIHEYTNDGLDLVFRFDTWFVAVIRQGVRHPGWGLTQQSLLDLKQAAAAEGTELVPVLFPTKEQAYSHLLGDVVPPGVAENFDLPIDLVATFCADHGMRCCDLREPLRRVARENRQIFHRISAHPNDEGHQVIAAAVKDCLEKYGLPGPAGSTDTGEILDGN